MTDAATAGPEHVTFRPGELIERLRVSRLTVGATAKRDLGRYYRLIDTVFDQWAQRKALTDQTWNAIGAFVCTRSWRMLPDAASFYEAASDFFASTWGAAYTGDRQAAMIALADLDLAEVCAIIDGAESELAPPNRVAATAGATSAAAAAAPA